jgi:drug/metabolite transporter (DMT)-like permease
MERYSSERAGVIAALVSSALGGTAGGLTRFAIGASDPYTLAAFRFGIAFVLILPIALALRSRWPQGRDWWLVGALGVLYFAVFFFIYNLALSYTTAARRSLALSTLPLVTMIIAALLGREQITSRKSAGVFLAMAGVATALGMGLADAPPDAWRGDLIMLGGTVIMALYSIWAAPLMQRSSRLGFLSAGMGFGSVASVLIAWQQCGLAMTADFEAGQWAAVIALGVLGGAAAFYLWVYALERTTPTRVTNTMTINPIAASLVGEPLGINLLVGIVGVGAGIYIASTPGREGAK